MQSVTNGFRDVRELVDAGFADAVQLLVVQALLLKRRVHLQVKMVNCLFESITSRACSLLRPAARNILLISSFNRSIQYDSALGIYTNSSELNAFIYI